MNDNKEIVDDLSPHTISSPGELSNGPYDIWGNHIDSNAYRAQQYLSDKANMDYLSPISNGIKY